MFILGNETILRVFLNFLTFFEYIYIKGLKLYIYLYIYIFEQQQSFSLGRSINHFFFLKGGSLFYTFNFLGFCVYMLSLAGAAAARGEYIYMYTQSVE